MMANRLECSEQGKNKNQLQNFSEAVSCKFEKEWECLGNILLEMDEG
jgi:hypothetical protein